MKSKTKTTPPLRFAEFEGEWRSSVLGELAEVKTGPFGSTLHQHDYVNVGTPIITVEHLDDLGIIHRNLPLVSDEDRNRLTSYALVEGDLVFSRVGSVDRCSIISKNENGWLFSGRLLRVRLKGNHPTFFNYVFQLERTKQKVISVAVGQTMPSISTAILKSIELNFTSLPEQQKIAAFLSAVDEKIGQLARKKELLLKYKKGVTRQIFEQKFRFNDDNGNDFPDWEPVELNKIASRVKEKNRTGEISSVLTNSATFGVVRQADYFDRNVANPENLTGYYVIQPDDFVYNPRISASAPVGPIKRNKLEPGVMSPLYVVFRFRSVNLDFIEKFFETGGWHDHMRSIANYGARHDRMNITQSDFFEMPILLPSEPEQERIAEFLLVIDRKIEQATQQLRLTKAFKKGLLQQMFV
jgi:type I restriction enzyme S subunit